jgi:putative ABC transport system permease protein
MSWFRTLFRRREVERELDRELRFHLESRVADLIAAGRSPEAARREALVEFGGLEAAKESCRDARAGQWLEVLLQDLRYAARQLRRDAGLAGIVVGMLALGIGGFTTLFSVIDGLLLHPRDLPEIERLVFVREDGPRTSANGWTSRLNFADWRGNAKAFDGGLASLQLNGFNLTGDCEPVTVFAGFVSSNFFRVLGVAPQLGRGFVPGDETPGKNQVAILSHRLWQSTFRGVPDIVGRTVNLSAAPYTIVGVMPAWLDETPDVPPLWVPVNATVEKRDFRWLAVYGRLRPGVTLAEARAEMNVIGAQLARQYPDTNAECRISVVPRLVQINQQWRAWLWTLLGAVAALLAIACANVANLLLARASTRQREMAVRAALGAGRGRLVRQLLTESVLLATFGGLAGALLAWWSFDALRAAAPAIGLDRLAYVRFEPRVLGFALVLSLATGVVFGLAPAWLSAGVDLREAMEQGSRGSSDGAGRGRLRRGLIVAEVALALVVLTTAGLLVRSFVRLSRTELGFDPRNATSFWIRRTDQAEKTFAFYQELIERIRRLPGVEAAGITRGLPILGWPEMSNSRVPIEGRSYAVAEEAPEAYVRGFTSGFLPAMGIRLLRGRDFTPADTNANVAIVSQSFARKYFAGSDPIGQRLVPAREIVGVVADVAMRSVEEGRGTQVYYPIVFTQTTTSLMIVVRTQGPPAALHPEIAAQVKALDPDVSIFQFRTLEQAVAGTAALRRFVMLLLTVFSAASVALAAGGLYGVIAYGVSQRRTEIGIRMALGADLSHIVRLVMGEGVRLIAVGWLIGLALFLALGRVIEARLFQTSAYDPLTLAGISAGFIALAALACWIPARRAAKVNPLVVLRAGG